MQDYGHDLQFGFFLDPKNTHPDATIRVAHILDDLGRRPDPRSGHL
jgi:hypothetical protein